MTAKNAIYWRLCLARAQKAFSVSRGANRQIGGFSIAAFYIHVQAIRVLGFHFRQKGFMCSALSVCVVLCFLYGCGGIYAGFALCYIVVELYCTPPSLSPLNGWGIQTNEGLLVGQLRPKSSSGVLQFCQFYKFWYISSWNSLRVAAEKSYIKMSHFNFSNFSRNKFGLQVALSIPRITN